MSKSVFVTGTSVITSGGVGNEDVWDSIINQKVVMDFREYQIANEKQITYPVFPIAVEKLINDWLEPKTIAWLEEENLKNDYDFILLLIASKLAILDADLPKDSVSSISLIIAHENLGINSLIDKILSPKSVDAKISSYEGFLKYREDFFNVQTFPHLFNLAKALNIEGQSYTVNNACASGLYALDLAKMMINSEQADVVLVVSSDYAHVTEHMWLEERGFVSKANKLKPFDRERDGSILGDGAAAIVLESSNVIKRERKQKIKCRYAGSSFKQDTWRMTLPDVTKHSYSKVISQTVNRFAKSEVDLLIPHGAGIPMWDLYEANEIHRAFKDGLPDITGFKSYTGHTLGANGLIETVILIYCMLNNTIPSLLNFSNMDEKINLPVVTQPTYKKLDTVMKTVSAYGGFHAASIFEKYGD